MAYLITYSQAELGYPIVANSVTLSTPPMYLLELNAKYPECVNIILFAIEISDDDFAAAADNI